MTDSFRERAHDGTNCMASAASVEVLHHTIHNLITGREGCI